ncbi:hypothetical protein [Olsenella sp. An293]|uniref:hypothetical protein n=1 Tax=Olsenella sp. An293 TaxID=1965626 RepID=UPI000B39ABF9|nr:hypothetical protein [Olsenella sp. An293]OUO31891.1 hypothetical protein B5F85_08530 [Olsenella sp. An293]
MAQTHLVREGMRPLTQGFADAYRAWLDNWTKRNKRFNPLGKDVTPEQFAEVLDALGIEREGRAESLGEVLGISSRQARNILSDPSVLTEERQRILLRHASRAFAESFGEFSCAKQALDEDERCGVDTSDSQAWVDCCDERLKAIESAAELLGCDHLRTRAQERARAEFVGRATIEAMHTMDARDRATLFRVMMGMLDSYKGSSERDRRARQIADALRKTAYGTHATLGDLADLIAYDYDGYLDHLERVEQQLDEETGANLIGSPSLFDYYGAADSAIETTVLSEYLGLDG